MCIRSHHLAIFLERMTFPLLLKVIKGAKIRNRYNQVPHLTQDTNGKVTNSQLDTTNKSQFRSALSQQVTTRHAQRHCKHKAEKDIKDPQKKYHLATFSKIFYWRPYTAFMAPTSPLIQMRIKTHRYLVCMKDP